MTLNWRTGWHVACPVLIALRGLRQATFRPHPVEGERFPFPTEGNDAGYVGFGTLWIDDVYTLAAEANAFPVLAALPGLRRRFAA